MVLPTSIDEGINSQRLGRSKCMQHSWDWNVVCLSHIFAAVTKIPKGLPIVRICLFGLVVSDVGSIHFCLSYFWAQDKAEHRMLIEASGTEPSIHGN